MKIKWKTLLISIILTLMLIINFEVPEMKGYWSSPYGYIYIKIVWIFAIISWIITIILFLNEEIKFKFFI